MVNYGSPFWNAIAAAAAALVLASCQGAQIGSLTGTVDGAAAKDALRTPEYAVKGATPYDQVWINKTTEALVDGFGQPRPKPRPPEFDKPAGKKQLAKVAPAPKAKPGLLQRLRPKAKDAEE